MAPGGTLLAGVRRRIARSDGVMAITGPGILTFRGDEDLRRAADPPELATPEAFRADPVRVWQWYDERRREIAGAEPGPAHLALARLEAAGKDVFIVTRNVDDFHERAGSRQVVHVHGSIWRVRCERDGFTDENRQVPLLELPPTCPCGNDLRPDVVWYGERLPPGPLEAVRAHLLEARSNVLLIVGAEASFGHVVQWAHEAHEQGALVVTVNPRPTGLESIADFRLEGRPDDILPGLVP
ncbi:MAG: Sir2 family NAD-dependent protein deacetylase [bacterium]